MNYKLGKIRGMQRTSDENGIFKIVAVDHGASLKPSIRPDAPETVSYEEVVDVKMSVVGHLAQHTTAMLLDPVFGLGTAVLNHIIPGNVGLLSSIEDGSYASTTAEAKRYEGWSIEKIKMMGATAVKCYVLYNPNDKAHTKLQDKFITDLVDDCCKNDLPLFAEPIGFGYAPEERPSIVIESAKRFCDMGIDILKAEFPIDVNHQPDEAAWVDACQALSEASSVPWVLLSAGVDFDTFVRQVRAACNAGASGYLAGRAIWKEAIGLDGTAREQFLGKTAVSRLHQLNEAAKNGRSWQDFYPALGHPPEQGWHQRYFG